MPANIKISLPDGSCQEMEKGTSVSQLARNIGPGLAKAALSGRVDGKPVDLDFSLDRDSEVTIITLQSEEGLDVLRHSTAHIMAQAVLELFPGTKPAIGPTIAGGFYYDFEAGKPFSEDDLAKIEKRMLKIIQADYPFKRRELAGLEALTLYKERGETYKQELIEDLGCETVSLYRQGDFEDLCRGPHIPSTGKVKAFKLLSVAGAYWRGDERNPMLQRIYGTAFANPKDLKKHLFRIEEAKRRDHRKLGKELDLFSFNNEAGPGLVIYHPKGAIVRQLLEDFERKLHFENGYQPVIGPMILKTELWKKSGHYENYRDSMYFTGIDGQEYGIKPMNCLSHMLVFKSKVRSYRELPIRYFELGTVYRHEKSGVLHGLLRVRGFTQDDAHILCAPEQLDGEIKGVMKLVKQVMAVFDFPYSLEISTRPEKSIGSDRDWERATAALIHALESEGLEYELNEGDGAFYGPKIDVKLEDALGRHWQCATIQCDFTLPERFDLNYTGADGRKHRPVMIHRVILGALERFLGILIEHYAGAFPFWLAPVQMIVANITDDQAGYARQIHQKLTSAGFRCEIDLRNEKIGYKIKLAQQAKIPYMLVLGNREMEAREVALRSRKEGDLGVCQWDVLLERFHSENSPGGRGNYCQKEESYS